MSDSLTITAGSVGSNAPVTASPAASRGPAFGNALRDALALSREPAGGGDTARGAGAEGLALAMVWTGNAATPAADSARGGTLPGATVVSADTPGEMDAARGSGDGAEHSTGEMSAAQLAVIAAGTLPIQVPAPISDTTIALATGSTARLASEGSEPGGASLPAMCSNVPGATSRQATITPAAANTSVSTPIDAGAASTGDPRPVVVAELPVGQQTGNSAPSIVIDITAGAPEAPEGTTGTIEENGDVTAQLTARLRQIEADASSATRPEDAETSARQAASGNNGVVVPLQTQHETTGVAEDGAATGDALATATAGRSSAGTPDEDGMSADDDDGRDPTEAPVARSVTSQPPAAAAYGAATGQLELTNRAAALERAGAPAPAASPSPASMAAEVTTVATPVSTRTVDQVASSLALTVSEGRTEATLTLRPAALGEVQVRIMQDRDGLVIRLSAERDAVGELLRSSLGELRHALAARQIPVADLHVLHNTPAAPPAGTSDSPFWQERPWERPRQQTDTDDQPAPEDDQDTLEDA